MAKTSKLTDSSSFDVPVLPTMRAPAWLRRVALAIALLGVVLFILAWPIFKLVWKPLPLETSLASLYLYLATSLWVTGSGFVLGFLAEASRAGETWSSPFARGVTGLLLVGGVLAGALMWSNPLAWIFCALTLAARWAASKPTRV